MPYRRNTITFVFGTIKTPTVDHGIINIELHFSFFSRSFFWVTAGIEVNQAKSLRNTRRIPIVASIFCWGGGVVLFRFASFRFVFRSVGGTDGTVRRTTSTQRRAPRQRTAVQARNPSSAREIDRASYVGRGGRRGRACFFVPRQTRGTATTATTNSTSTSTTTKHHYRQTTPTRNATPPPPSTTTDHLPHHNHLTCTMLRTLIHFMKHTRRKR